MPTTSNFGWTTPADTDLVKDGAAAIRTLGNGIDTSFLDLKGGTSGQILSKNSDTDLDFVWIANDQGDITAVTAGTGISGGGTSGAVTITNSMATEIDAKGDLIVGTGADTFARLPVGTNGHTLVADSVEATGLKWAAPASGGKVLQVVNATHSTQVDSSSTARVDTGLTATITPTLATSKILVLIFQNALFKSAGNSANQFMFKVLRGATEVQTTNAYMYTGTASEAYGVWSVSFLDSPATTSATTYKTTFANALSASLVRCQDNGLTSSIVLMEIGV